jgi:hypothetical protein
MTQLIGVFSDYAKVPNKETKYDQVAIYIFQFHKLLKERERERESKKHRSHSKARKNM